MLFSWLLSSLSDSILPTVVNCMSSWQIWDEIHQSFHSQSSALISKLRSDLKGVTKGSSYLQDYLKRVRTITNTLTSLGEPVSYRDHLDALCDGLPDEFDAIITVVTSKTPP